MGRLLRAYPGVSVVRLQDHGGHWHRFGSVNADRTWLLEDTDEPSPELPVLENELRRGVSEALKNLRPREAEVLRLYFGLEGCSQMTLEEIGQSMNLTRERIRQIKEEALEKMRSRRKFRFLSDYREMATLH